MKFREKGALFALIQGTFLIACAIFVYFFRTDHFMVPILTILGIGILYSWTRNYIQLSNGMLTRRRFHFLFTIPVDTITRITPHGFADKRGRFHAISIYTTALPKPVTLNITPTKLQPFLATLHTQAPQAQYFF